MTPQRWSDAKIQCSMDAIAEALNEGIGITLGIFEDSETHEGFLAVYQNVPHRWIRSIAQDFSMEWSMFIDGFGDGDYTCTIEPEHLGRIEAVVEGRTAVMSCLIRYFFAPEQVDEIVVHPNLDHSSGTFLATRRVWEGFMWDEVNRVSADMKTLYPEIWAKSQQDVQERHNLLSYYERQFDA